MDYYLESKLIGNDLFNSLNDTLFKYGLINVDKWIEGCNKADRSRSKIYEDYYEERRIQHNKYWNDYKEIYGLN